MIKIMPNATATAPHLVAALLYDGLCAFEFGIAAEVFGLDRPDFGPDWYRFVTCSEERRPVRASVNVLVTPEAGLDRLAEADTIVIPGWNTRGEAPSPAIAEAIHSAHSRGARLVTICSGVFLLASLGLVAGKRVTTHWKYVDGLRALFPSLEVAPDVLYVDEGRILTSAGSAAGIDLLLHIVRKDFGADHANRVARRMVTQPHRDGGQAQFIERPVPQRPNGRLAPLLDSIRSRPAERWTIERMARDAAMSQRTLIRRFKEGVGLSPGEWLIATRTDSARELLEAGRMSIDEVAALVGFGSVATLRHHFRQRVGISPARYRARFAATKGAEVG